MLREDDSEAGRGRSGRIGGTGRQYHGRILERSGGDGQRVLDEHGYHTGDLAVRDEEGFLYVVGRSREMIKSGAHRIAPKEIEEILQEHPDVHEAAVVGVPDEILGEAIAAFISARSKEPLSEKDVIDWCRRRLPSHKVPGLLRVIEDFERNASGKINKLALADTL